MIALTIFLLTGGLAVRCWLITRESQDIFALPMNSPARDAALHHARLSMIVWNAVMAMVMFPVVLAFVHRIFEPIRTLVSAADRIAAGDMTARVAIHRPDAIGTLARSFNKMVQNLRRHQEALESANARLAMANHDLEEKVRLRTAQLETANRRLNIEIAEKEDFLRAISHDLSAPLRNISGMAAMLLHKNSEAFDDEVVHRLQRIQKNVEVETSLISELLELSKIKTRRQRVETVDLNELVREVADVFEGDFVSRGIQFHVESPLPAVQCEKARLRQLFQNLIDNAVKYMGEGTAHPQRGHRMKEIRIGAAVREDEASFYVQDTGMGIDAEDKESIFYVFRRGRNAAVRSQPGKGVGLASVKSIVETFHGNIWVESEVGCGSTFRFTINGKHLVESKTLAGAM